MHRMARPLVLLLLLAPQDTPSIAADSSPETRRITERARIVPRVDHHQHIVGPAAVIRWPTLPPPAALPPDLSRVLEGRNRIMGTADLGNVFTGTARMVDGTEESAPWIQGREALARRVEAYEKGTRFIPLSFAAGDSAAHIAGVAVIEGPPETRLNFTLGLRKDASGAWRIDTEQATEVPPPPFAQPLDGDHLVRDLDETGIERAVVLSVAYFFASPNRKWPGDEYANVRAENDWVAAQAARHPDRLIPFCGVSPIKDYAVEEIRRCARDLEMKGLKLHFRSSRVDVLNPEHLEKVRRVFRVANELKLPIVVHTNVRPYGRAQAEVFLKELLPLTPDVVVQIAHLWGGNEFVPEALTVFADAVAAKDPRAKNLYFDLTEVEAAAGESKETWAAITGLIRRIGLDRILYGSDAAAVAEAPPTSLRWARLRRKLPLTNDEVADIADNVAPYLR
jgi:predicted TIM-barrel fold metal-dependent hydrolase